MYIKVHKVLQNKVTKVVVALCDDDLLGKTLGDVFFVSPRFYEGEKCSVHECVSYLKKADTVNAVGKESVGLLIKEGFVSENEVISVGGVPHAQVFVLNE